MTNFQHAPRRPRARRLALVGIVATGGLLLTACGGNDDMKGMDHGSKDSSASAKATATPAPGGFNDADVSFAQMMIPHHQQALEMAKLADGRAGDKQITSLAGKIEKAQDPEIRTMKSWLKSWGKPVSPSSDSMPGMDHGSGGMDHGSGGMDHGSGGMDGMMSQKDMDRLEAAKGAAFDRAFAQMMIDHHKGAITMAEDEQKKGRNATAKKLAGDVIKNQSAEVTTLRKILDRL
ncbi:DUF305 domain-containing protein [Streptomyces sp. Rer75]|uniref:DUF305 domain-containing protein n=1 Tax=unclassified Streptomyces TaxID=2593676 RepID=UPI0015D07FA5|nr:DUF305 domain-containing protein [Streptomyces sp. Rer75]QLH26203.1 DUF305 domain-containing protein [Streptomyces sp. Rer75]